MKDVVDLMLKHESAIVWTQDVSDLEYVRQRVNCYARRRTGGMQFGMQFRSIGRRVGYSILTPDAPHSTGRWWARREFWISRDDRPFQPEGPYQVGTPYEGVDPLTVAPGVLGLLTERAWGGPLPSFIHLDRYAGA